MMQGDSFGSGFERILVGLLAVVTGVLLVYLAIQGPLFLGNIHYKSAPVIANQIIGQDAVNLGVIVFVGFFYILRGYRPGPAESRNSPLCRK